MAKATINQPTKPSPTMAGPKKTPMRVKLDRASEAAAKDLSGRVIARSVEKNIKILKNQRFSGSKA